MKTTFKKSLSMLLALMMVVALMLSVTSCGGGGESGGVDPEEGRADFIASLGGVSETFAGSVSTVEYETAEAAASAYVVEEVVGQKEASIVSAESKGELDSAAITALNIPEEYSEGILAVEEYEVEYSVLAGGDEAVSGENTRVTVYIIKYESAWKYFTPAPIVGETITKAYYDSVFNSDKFKNCTYENVTSMNMVIDVSAEGYSESIELTLTLTQRIKFTEGKIYLEQTCATEANDPTYADMVDIGDDMTVYLETVGDEIVCYTLNPGGQWSRSNIYISGFGDLSQLAPFHDQYIDYSYFTKADFGFKLADENADRYVEQLFSAVSQMAQSMGGGDLDMDMYAEYYVADGALTGMRMDLELNMEISESGASMDFVTTANSTIVCSNYGTTVVERPAGIN